ncbi:DUF6279 family lipoprotein [Luminiphilus sp.]|jgi:hypothetical protein|nr:DUF6279 family lipoprotein [Luminiphilus sp.]MDC0573536.1 DUF6279 family lipoprotein [Luminiphilus sp.]
MKTGQVCLPALLAQRRRPSVTRWALLGCLLIVAILNGCSATQVIYNRADILIRWYLDDYVTLDRDQQARFDERLDALLEWHRQEELPEYVLLLDDALVILDTDVSLAATRSMAEGIESAAIRLQDRFLELLLSTGENLTSAQRADFIEALLAKQEAFEADRLARSDAEYRDDLGQRFDKQLGRYLGRLTDEQARRLQEGVAEMTRLDHFWLQDRRVWILALSNILLADEPDWADQVRALIAGRDEALLPDYREGIEHNGEVILQLSRDVLLMRTEKQDKKLRARLIALRDDLAALSDA